MKSILILASLFFFLSLTGKSAYTITITTTLDVTEPPANVAYYPTTETQTGRLNRNLNVISSCGMQKVNPGEIFSTGSRTLDQYRFIALSSGCVTVTLSDAGDNLLFAVVYDEQGINLTDTSLNHLADIGASPTSSNPSRTMSFDVEAEQIFHVVVHEVNPGDGVGQSYTLDVDGVKLEPDFSLTETLDTTAPVLTPAGNGTTTLQTGRLRRQSPPSFCDTPKTNPGLLTTTGNRQVDSYEFMPLTTGCAIITLSHTGSGDFQVVAYDKKGFNPLDPSDNYLADMGSSVFNNSKVFSFNVTAGQPFSISVNEINPSASIGESYTLNISNVDIVHSLTIDSVLDEISPIGSENWTAADGIQIGRLTRNGTISTCADLKPNPGIVLISGNRQYDRYTFIPDDSGCIEVTINSESSVFSTAYNDLGYNPADPSVNYLADSGFSPNPDITFGFKVVAGVPFTVVVHEVSPGGGLGQDYTLTLRGNALPGDTKSCYAIKAANGNVVVFCL